MKFMMMIKCFIHASEIEDALVEACKTVDRETVCITCSTNACEIASALQCIGSTRIEDED